MIKKYWVVILLIAVAAFVIYQKKKGSADNYDGFGKSKRMQKENDANQSKSLTLLKRDLDELRNQVSDISKYLDIARNPKKPVM